MVRQVGVHDDDEVPLGVLQSVDVGRAQAKFFLPGSEDYFIFAIDILALLGDLQRSVGTSVVDDNDLVVQLGRVQVLDQEPQDQGQVFPLIVSGKEDGIFVIRTHAAKISKN